ncbi:MAG: hypothetical protein P4L57_02315 [Rhizomicrobium sp.]|nr:hypothetical protein [Rhizomicrobium sp.]
MKLLLRRDERSSIMGKPIFVLEMRAELSEVERGWIQKYKFGSSLLYTKKGKPNADTTTLAGVGQVLVHYAMDLTVSVNDLVNGKKIECKDIMEMLAVEQQIREAAQNFGSVLRAASQFGGEEVIEL